MTAEIISGKDVAAAIRAELTEEVAAMKKAHAEVDSPLSDRRSIGPSAFFASA